jgi:hypothetical protein
MGFLFSSKKSSIFSHFLFIHTRSLALNPVTWFLSNTYLVSWQPSRLNILSSTCCWGWCTWVVLSSNLDLVTRHPAGILQLSSASPVPWNRSWLSIVSPCSSLPVHYLWHLPILTHCNFCNWRSVLYYCVQILCYKSRYINFVYIKYIVAYLLKASRDIHCFGTALQTLLLLGNSFISTQQYKSCWKQCFLWYLCQGYIYNEDQVTLVSPSSVRM